MSNNALITEEFPVSATSTHGIVAELPAGGSNPNYFDWLDCWYPVHYIDDLDKSQLTRFTLLERDIVIWWDRNQGSWRAFLDQCPHRLAPLSAGRINKDGWLECPYHGWAFSGGGRCEVIPQQEVGGKAEISQRACVTSFPTIVCQGLLFVYPGNPENAAQTKVPMVEPLAEDPDGWICLNTFRDLPYDALTLMENVLDSSHVPFTHHRSVGNRANASPVNLEVLSSGKWGFQGIWEEGPRLGTLGKQYTTFIAPGLMWHDLTSQQYGRTMTVVYATPIRKGECRLFARFPFKFNSKLPGLFLQLTPRWYSHIGQNGVLEDDQIFLHYQERYFGQRGGSSNFNQAFYLPTKADLYVVQLRSWIKQFNADPWVNTKISSLLNPSPTKEALLERYHSHTEKCGSCRQALRNIQQLRWGIAITTVVISCILPLLVFFSNSQSTLTLLGLTLVELSGTLTWLGLGKLEERFYKGREIPPRNLP